jgi:hypothetical protein
VSDQAAIPAAPVLLAVPVVLVLANLIAAGPGWAAARISPAITLRSEYWPRGRPCAANGGRGEG